MRKNIEDIEIKEPPIEELKKKSSCLKRSCTTGCGCIFIFIIGSLVLLKFASGPQSKELRTVPENFPKNIPVYDKDSVEKIRFTPGGENNKTKEIAAFFPKLILSPILMTFGENKMNLTWDNFLKFMQENKIDKRDTVEIDWKNLPAEPTFVEKYYLSELKKANYTITTSTENLGLLQFSFSKEDVDGVFYAEDNAEIKGTDFLSLTVKLQKQ